MEGAKNSVRFRSFPLDRERVNERPRFPNDVQANERTDESSLRTFVTSPANRRDLEMNITFVGRNRNEEMCYA